MRATLMYGAGDVRVENVPDATLQQPTDALVRIVRSCICGSDLWPYGGLPAQSHGNPMGHEFVGVVEAVGSEVSGFSAGDVVVAPFSYADGTCDYCQAGFHINCRNGGLYGRNGLGGGQAEAIRVPWAMGSLVKVPVSETDPVLTSLLALCDVMATGQHAATRGGVTARTHVTVIGDGAVGLCAVIGAKRLGAQEIVLMGRHQDRTDLGREFGATEVVAERGEAGIERIRELTRGDGSHVVLECVGTSEALTTAMRIVRTAGTVSRVGVPQYEDAAVGRDMLMRNITFTGGASSSRHYMTELLPETLDGRIQPGRVLDREIPLEQAPEGYRAMASREALKVVLAP